MDDCLARMPTISVELHGAIPADEAQAIRQEVESCYQALATPLPEAVSLCLFDTIASWRQYTAQRREEMGIVTAGEEGFLATHEAWEGFPQLNVCLERLQAQPGLIQQGALHEVVAHSVLHGRPDYYRFQVPRALVSACEDRGVELEVLQQILYFVAIAVKGSEAVALLVRRGFIQDQVALAFHQLEAREDDVDLWKMARYEHRARLLYLSAQLKPLLCLQPLLPYAPTLAEAAQAMLAHLPVEAMDRLALVVQILSTERSGDTHRDVSAGLALVLNWL